MTELIEYLASEELSRREEVLAYAIGIAIAVGVLAFLLIPLL